MATLLKKKIFTYEDIYSLPEGNYEIIDGERKDMTPAGFRHGYFENLIAALLGKNLGSKGYIAVGEVGIVIRKNPFRVRTADVVYISKTKCPERPVGMLEVSPELVVEILSEDSAAKDVNDKVKDYLSIGISRVVLVDPYTEIVTIFEHGKKEAGYYSFDDEFEIFDGLVARLKDLA